MSTRDEIEKASRLYPDPENVDSWPNDVPDAKKKTLGDYLSSLTLGDDEIQGKKAANAYPVTSDNSETSLSLTDSDGSPAPLSNSNTKNYMDDLASEAVTAFAALSGGVLDPGTGGTFTAAQMENIGLDKNDQISGHLLLSNHVNQVFTYSLDSDQDTPAELPLSSKVDEEVRNVLDRNRFSSRRGFVRKGKEFQQGLYHPVEAASALGRYEGAIGNAGRASDKAVTQNQLAKVGKSLILAAAGDNLKNSDNLPADLASAIGNTIGNNSKMGAAIAGAVKNAFGGSEDMPMPTGGGTVDTLSLRASSASGSPRKGDSTTITDEFDPAEQGSEISETQYNNKSFGTLNHHLEPFSGPFPSAMMVTALANGIAAIVMCLALALIVDAIILVIILLTLGDEQDMPGSTPGHQLAMGQWRGIGQRREVAKGFDPMQVAEFAEAIAYNMLRYLNVNIPLVIWLRPNISKKILPYVQAAAMGSISFFLGGLMSPKGAGFYAVVTRNAIRDARQVGRAPAAPQSGIGGLSAGLEGMFNTIEAFRDSASFKFCNRMADLGNITEAAGVFMGLLPERYAPGGADINKFPDSPKNRLAKSRFAGGRSPLSTGMLPSMYVMPQSIITNNSILSPYGAAQDGYSKPGLTTNDVAAGSAAFVANPDPDKFDETSNPLLSKFPGVKQGPAGVPLANPSRLPVTYVEAMEATLEAEYCPFYFHDLRTNEIIAFHAFLTAISDSFSPKYTETAGFGRLDAAQIYGGTKRAISLSFQIHAMSAEDFDEMWFKINKLVTLCYPQWSAGTVRSFETKDDKNAQKFGKFTMPFSQVPTASPMIRLRVGDLFSSNYSNQAIARMMGIGTNNFNLNMPAMPQFGEEPPPNEVRDLKAKLNEEFNNLGGDKYEKAKEDPDSYLNKGTEADYIQNFVNPFTIEHAGNQIGVGPTRFVASTGAGFMPLGTVFTFVIKNAEGKTKKFIQRPILIDYVPGGPDAQLDIGFKIFNKVKLPTDAVYAAELIRYDIPMKAKKRFDKATEAQDEDAMKAAAALCGFHVKLLGTVQYGKKDAPTIMPLPAKVKEKTDGAAIFCQSHSIKIQTFPKDQNAAALAGPIAAALAGGKFKEDMSKDLPTAWALKGLTGFNNPIIRAFDSTKGKGLAGVITNMSFDWGLNNIMWETTSGQVAPKGCTVTIAFSPIHDITPGLDADGMNRAPVYSVGEASRGYNNITNPSAPWSPYGIEEQKEEPDLPPEATADPS